MTFFTGLGMVMCFLIVCAICICLVAWLSETYDKWTSYQMGEHHKAENKKLKAEIELLKKQGPYR